MRKGGEVEERRKWDVEEVKNVNVVAEEKGEEEETKEDEGGRGGGRQ